MSKIKKISENIIELDGERYVKEDSKGWLDIPELGISVEIEVHDKNKSWDKLGLKDSDFFINQPFDLSRKNGYIAGFGAGSDCANLDCVWDSSYSYSDLGVRFVRKKISKKVKKSK
jgi:hypothetical protein